MGGYSVRRPIVWLHGMYLRAGVTVANPVYSDVDYKNFPTALIVLLGLHVYDAIAHRSRACLNDRSQSNVSTASAYAIRKLQKESDHLLHMDHKVSSPVLMSPECLA